jgi:hypothetical protein
MSIMQVLHLNDLIETSPKGQVLLLHLYEKEASDFLLELLLLLLLF